MKKENKNRINEQIREREVRLVSEEGTKVIPTYEALRIARSIGADLIEISSNTQPPVCKIMDYNKFLYEQKKKEKELKAKQAKVEIKEIRLTPQTDEHDYQFKLKHAKEFIEKGDRVKLSVFFKGRSIMYKDQGKILLLRFADDLSDIATAEKLPIMEGKRMIMYMIPKKK